MIEFNRVFIASIICIIVVGCSAPEKETSTSIYKEFAKTHNGVQFCIPPGMVSVLLDNQVRGTEEIKELINDSHSICFLVVSTQTYNQSNDLASSCIKRLKHIDFVEIVTATKGGENIQILVHSHGNTINEMAVLISNTTTFYAINLHGQLQIEKITNLTQIENLSALSNLDKLKR